MTDVDTVLVSRSNNAKRRTYHDNEDCPRLPANPREWDREAAEAWGYTRCKWCSSNPGGDATEANWSHYNTLVALGKSGGDSSDA